MTTIVAVWLVFASIAFFVVAAWLVLASIAFVIGGRVPTRYDDN
jgi:hypothetical protein